MMSDTSRIAEVSPLTHDYELMHQVHMIDATTIYDDKHTEESYVLKVRDVFSVPDMDRNCILSHVMREPGINESNS